MGAMLEVVSKVAVILVLILVGCFVTKRGILTERGASEMTTILIKLVTPCVIINSFVSSGGSLDAGELLMAVVLPAVWHAAGLGASFLFFRGEPDARRKVLRFSVIFCNTGFMGIPLVQGIVGDKAVIYASFGVVVFNLLCWTYGYSMMSGGAKMNIKTVLLNPGVVGLAVGLPIYFFKVQLPEIAAQPLGYIADLNTPLAMLVIGTYIAKADLHSFVSDMSVYRASALRLLALPAVTLGLLLLIRPEQDLFLATMVQASTPAAANAVLFAVQYKQDSELASKLVAVSTALSIVTIPVLTVIAQALY